MKRERIERGGLRAACSSGRHVVAGLFCMVGLFGASCSDDTQPGPSGENVPIEITTNLRAGIMETRAASAITSGSIGVFVRNANGYPPQYNVKYTYNGGWKPESEFIYIRKTNASLCAYHPYGAVTFAANSTTTTLTAQKYDATKDMYYATTGGDAVCNTTPQASFAMSRAYVRLGFSIQRDYVGNCNITNVNVKSGTGLVTAATLDIATGTVSGTPTAGGFTYALNSGNIAAGAPYTGYDVLLPPQAVASGLSITLTVDGVNRSVTIPATRFTDNELKAGNQYTVSLLIRDTEVAYGTVQIGDFATGSTVTSSGETV